MPEAGRVPPQAVDIEMVVLGAMMVDGSRVHLAFEMLSENDFYKPANSWAFKAMKTLFESNVPVDMLTVLNELMKMGKVDEVGAGTYLADCTTRATSAANLEHYCKIVLRNRCDAR